MVSSIFLEFFLLISSVLLLQRCVIAQIDPSIGYSLEEREALFGLKAALDHPFLNGNWNGPHCNFSASKWYGVGCFNGYVKEIKLDGLGLRGNISLNAIKVFDKMSVLSFKNNSLLGSVMDFSSNVNLKLVDLSSNFFSGKIPVSLTTLLVLESLFLQNNALTGPIPEFRQLSLKEFDVSNNNLSGSIPATPALKPFGYGSYSGNNGLCGQPSPIACNNISQNDTTKSQESTDENSDKKSFGDFLKKNVPLYLLIFDIVLLIVVILLFVFYYKKSKKLKTMMKEDQPEEEKVEEMDEQRIDTDQGEKRVSNNNPGQERGKLVFMGEEEGFEMGDLLKASAEGLGQGTFGNCYKAMMDGKSSVVVKRLRNLKPFTGEEFMKQLLLIANQKHPNLLPILAYYNSQDEKLLVYKYMANGNLFDRLHGDRRNGNRIPFRWSSRLSIARGVARALEYLHLNASLPIAVPHGNLKSTNILLHENDTALVSDYGLASLIALPVAAQRSVCFKSPEYLSAKKVSKKSDVWSYGCLLLELLTGKIAAYTAPAGVRGVDLCSWVHKAVREEWTAEIFDGEIALQRKVAIPGMLRLLQIALSCIDKSPEKRPEMSEVVREVENIQFNESEDEDDLSMDRSFTDDSLSTIASMIANDDHIVGYV
ncbi:hypothetical protein UlMin_032668 [Ulmus minor]